MDSSGVRRKMARKNCDRINAVTVTVLKTLVRRRTTGFFSAVRNFILTPTVYLFTLSLLLFSTWNVFFFCNATSVEQASHNFCSIEF